MGLCGTLTPGDDLKARFIGWQDDGSAFYVATNERDPKAFDLYRYATADYARSEVYRNVDGINLDELSGNGRWLSLVRTKSNADSDVYVVNLDAHKPEPRDHTAPGRYPACGLCLHARQ